MSLFTELRLGLRSLTRTPGFLLLAVATLALGTGVAAAMFSVTESVLWRPLPFKDSERLVLISEHNAKSRPAGSPASAGDFVDWRDRAGGFQGLAAISYDSENHTLTGAGERVRSLGISAGFFETLGVQPALGRTFRREEESGTAHVALLTDDFWRAHFAGTAGAVGQQFRLDREVYTVAGVLPPDFHLESVMDGRDPQMFVPLDLTGAAPARGDRVLAVVGRIKTSVSLAAAASELDSIARRLAAEHRQEGAGWNVRVENLRESFTRYHRTSLYLFLGFAVFVLLISCANVAGLQLVRVVGRHREYALRVALGARRAALLRQALTETVWIALPGGAAGTLLGAWGLSALRATMPPLSLARASHISMDLTALAFVLAVSLSITFVAALAPVLLTGGINLDMALREGSKSVAASPRTERRLKALIAGEMALSFVLLFGAGLFASSYLRLKDVALGFDPQGVLTMRVTAGGAQRSSAGAQRNFYLDAMLRASQAPGVRQVAIASDMPFAGGQWIPYQVAGHARPPSGEEPRSLARVISPGYFDLLRIPLLAGRAFTRMDSELGPRVAIINENLARSAFAGQNPIGKVLTVLPGGDVSIPTGPVEIVGLASNTKELGLDEVPFEDVYLPFAQNPRRTMSLVVKAGGAAAAVAAGLRKGLQRLDLDSALYDAATLDETVVQQLSGQRFRLKLVSVFAVLAALLAAVGIYGAIAYSVAQRTREFGLRMALGAMPGAIRGLTLEHTTRLTITGVLCGLGVSLVLGKLLRSALYMVPHQHTGLIYGVGIRDPLSLCAAGAIVLALAALASLAPAERAARVEPSAALRDE